MTLKGSNANFWETEFNTLRKFKAVFNWNINNQIGCPF